MQNSWDFSMCISTLLNILDISSNKLAKAINVDPSLISRWKTGKRKVSHESNHLKAIADYFSSKILNDYQKTNIINIISKFNLPISIEYSNNMKEYIYILLISSLQGSKNVRVKNNNIRTSNTNHMVNPKFSINTNHNENICYPSHMIDNKSECLQQYSITETGYISNFEMIIGHGNVINAGINLLKSLPKKPDYMKESILITFLTESDSFSNFESTNLEWHNALLESQAKGWSINKIMDINENINRNMKIINEVLVNIMSKKYHPYYLNKYDSIIKLREFIMIPSIGILVCLCSGNTDRIDCAFLIRDEQASRALKGALDLCTNYSKPLITNRFTEQNMDLLTEIANYEELSGDRFTLNFCLNYIIIPLELIEKFSFSTKEKMPDNKVFKRDFQYKRMKKAFDKQIKNYRFLDIYSKSSIENLVKISKSPLTQIDPSDILKLFENIIYMLKKYDNYNIGLLNNSNLRTLSNFSCMIKDSNLILTNYSDRSKKTINKSWVSISEPNIVNTFKNYFGGLWDQIAPINKEKESVISWFESQMKGLNNL